MTQPAQIAHAARDVLLRLPLTEATLDFDIQVLYMTLDNIHESEIYMLLYKLLDGRQANHLLPGSFAQGAWHTLALRIPHACLEEVFEYVVGLHNFSALMPVLARVKRDLLSGVPILPSMQCSMACGCCQALRKLAVSASWGTFLFEDDYIRVREAIQKAKQLRIWEIRRPILWTNPKTDAVFQELVHRAKNNWRYIFLGSLLAMLWRRWHFRQLHPESRYMRRVAARFLSRALELDRLEQQKQLRQMQQSLPANQPPF